MVISSIHCTRLQAGFQTSAGKHYSDQVQKMLMEVKQRNWNMYR
jgi:hypothetical protein